jgi:putative transcriptional regulator
MRSELFNELKESLGEMVDHARGKKELRTTVLPQPPKKLSGQDIASLRRRLRFSQAIFARYLNVSVRSVQAWEQGKREPEGAAMKLLEIAEEKPEVLFNL